MSSKVAACSSVTPHLPNRLSVARNIASPSSCVIGSARNAWGAVSTGCNANMVNLHMASYMGCQAIWQCHALANKIVDHARARQDQIGADPQRQRCDDLRNPKFP